MCKYFLITLFLFTAFICFGQNVDFHDNLSKFQNNFDESIDHIKKAEKNYKNALKSKDEDSFKKEADNTKDRLEKALKELKTAEKNYNRASDDAKNYACENTVNLMKKYNNFFSDITKEVNKQLKTIKTATNEKKFNKAQKSFKDIKNEFKSVYTIYKDSKKPIAEIDKSCT